MVGKDRMKKHSGFTLMELMIVVAIIGIISAIAFPSYNSYMKKSRRADAKVGLSKLADKQERFYLQENIYATTTAALGLANPVVSKEGYYNITVSAGAGTAGFILSAAAVGAQTSDTTTSAGDCTTMTLSSTGARTPVDCW
jgi:type IV pilus assembly protein PilE